MSVTTRHPGVEDPPTAAVSVAARSRGSAIIQALVILLLVAILATVLLMLAVVASIANAPGQLAGGIGNQLGGVATQARSAADGVQQAVQNATDPNHPPAGLTYDTEFGAFAIWHVGDHLGDTGRHVVVLQSIQRRDNAQSADTVEYAIIHVELRQPNELRVLGQVVRSDSQPRDYAVYKGETFRIAGTVYRVNWISQQSNAMAAGAYLHPDAVTVPFKFDSD